MTSPILRVLVVDDELLARTRLLRLLAALPDVESCGACETAEDALRRIREGGVDVVLLDIQMPGLSGLEALAVLGERGPQVVFTTAHPDFALQAFEGGATDYLLKPIEAGRLAKALERTRGRRAAPALAGPAAALPKGRVALQTPRGIVVVAPAELSHAVLENEVVTAFLADGTRHFTDIPLQELQDRLPDSFFRAHRRVLLNLDLVARLEPIDSGGFRAVMSNKQAVVVSRQAARELRRLLGLSRGPDDRPTGGIEPET